MVVRFDADDGWSSDSFLHEVVVRFTLLFLLTQSGRRIRGCSNEPPIRRRSIWASDSQSPSDRGMEDDGHETLDALLNSPGSLSPTPSHQKRAREEDAEAGEGAESADTIPG